MEQYKVSVVIPVYNGGHGTGFLERQVNSVLHQTYPNIELILVNDGSKDDSLDICNDFRSKDSRVVIIDKPNGGESSARNAGICAATGDYVSVIDQDDELDLNMYAGMMQYANEFYPDVIKSDFLCVFPSGREVPMVIEQPKGILLDRKEIEETVIPYMIGIKRNDQRKAQGHWSMISKRSLLSEHHVLYDETLLKENDHRFLVNVMAYANSLVFCEGTFYHWLKRGDSHTSDYSPRFWNILNNFALYEKLFSGLYDFSSPDKIKYNVEILTESLEYVLLHSKDCNAREEIVKILQDEHVENWMSLLVPETKFEKKLKNDVANKKYSVGYTHTIEYYFGLRLKNLFRKVFHA